MQSLLVLLSGDVEIHPGPTRTPKESLSICHWNLNSISAHNYVKLSSLRAYLSETRLSSSNSPNDDTLEIFGYDLVHSDHPFHSKRELPTLTNYQRQLFIRMHKF